MFDQFNLPIPRPILGVSQNTCGVVFVARPTLVIPQHVNGEPTSALYSEFNDVSHKTRISKLLEPFKLPFGLPGLLPKSGLTVKILSLFGEMSSEDHGATAIFPTFAGMLVDDIFHLSIQSAIDPCCTSEDVGFLRGDCVDNRIACARKPNVKS